MVLEVISKCDWDASFFVHNSRDKILSCWRPERYCTTNHWTSPETWWSEKERRGVRRLESYCETSIDFLGFATLYILTPYPYVWYFHMLVYTETKRYNINVIEPQYITSVSFKAFFRSVYTKDGELFENGDLYCLFFSLTLSKRLWKFLY